MNDRTRLLMVVETDQPRQLTLALERVAVFIIPPFEADADDVEVVRVRALRAALGRPHQVG